MTSAIRLEKGHYEIPCENRGLIIKSFIIQTKSKNKAIDYAKKFTTTNKFKLIEVVENY